ncbi:hypothetical protein [Flavobacterium terrae]|uniref:Cytochrome C n=1 Tax=Flavobacterium terrae TaxID=415425 RepID=A0A1M6HC39_9FLAO|nr:hypothetical protein [Flavobacterium terrae]SHJ19679.1 hypothetical protein SAMN05444363_2958 [Flavobacterium terrae]
MRGLIFLSLILFFTSCEKKQEKCELPAKEEKKFEMYEMSEMAMLMEQMYVDNERLKQRIINGDTIGKFPQHFLEIHKAVMTDKQENDNFFKSHALAFIQSQKMIYEDPKNAKEHFNASIDECVKCHEVKCGGPIVRIKKLYIK